FVGALDSTADITGITVGMLSCSPASPGGCNPFDFAVDRLYLTTSIPEPATLIPVLVFLSLLTLCRRQSRKCAIGCGIFCGFILISAATSIRAQDPVPISPEEAPLLHVRQVLRTLPDIDPDLTPALSLFATATQALPTWRYEIVSPLNGITYGGY